MHKNISKQEDGEATSKTVWTMRSISFFNHDTLTTMNIIFGLMVPLYINLSITLG